MIVGMKGKKPALKLQTQLRYAAKTKQVLERLIADLKASGTLLYFGDAISQEAIINACWLWLGDMGPERVEKELGPYVARVEAIVRAEAEKSEGGKATPIHGRAEVEVERPTGPAKKSRRNSGNSA